MGFSRHDVNIINDVHTAGTVYITLFPYKLQNIPKDVHKISKNFQIVQFQVHIWNEHVKCIKMSTNKPVFGPVVLEIAGRTVMTT